MAKCGLRYKGYCAIPEQKWSKSGRCPRFTTTDDYCNIIPANKKPGTVRIKAWAYRCSIDNTIMGASTTKDHNYKIPCTILIDRKYLKRKI